MSVSISSNDKGDIRLVVVTVNQILTIDEFFSTNRGSNLGNFIRRSSKDRGTRIYNSLVFTINETLATNLHVIQHNVPIGLLIEINISNIPSVVLWVDIP